jgi:hypothetical protein
MHTLYSTPTLQDITTVENDLKCALAHFEDFLDHVTDHINNYESLRSFNQQVPNITKIQTFKESIKRSPQFDTLIATWETHVHSRISPTTLSTNMVTYLQTSNRAGAMHTTSGSPEKAKEKQKEKEKVTRTKENPTKGKAAEWVASSIGTPKISTPSKFRCPRACR